MTDLWGDLPEADGVMTPLKLLKKQASALTKKTSGLLVGDIVQRPGSSEINAKLIVRVPVLNDYVLSLLNIEYSMTGTRMRVYSEVGSPIEQIPVADFENWLGNFLKSERVRDVIAQLMAHARSL